MKPVKLKVNLDDLRSVRSLRERDRELVELEVVRDGLVAYAWILIRETDGSLTIKVEATNPRASRANLRSNQHVSVVVQPCIEIEYR